MNKQDRKKRKLNIKKLYAIGIKKGKTKMDIKKDLAAIFSLDVNRIHDILHDKDKD